MKVKLCWFLIIYLATCFDTSMVVIDECQPTSFDFHLSYFQNGFKKQNIPSISYVIYTF